MSHTLKTRIDFRKLIIRQHYACGCCGTGYSAHFFQQPETMMGLCETCVEKLDPAFYYGRGNKWQDLSLFDYWKCKLRVWHRAHQNVCKAKRLNDCHHRFLADNLPKPFDCSLALEFEDADLQIASTQEYLELSDPEDTARHEYGYHSFPVIGNPSGESLRVGLKRKCEFVDFSPKK